MRRRFVIVSTLIFTLASVIDATEVRTLVVDPREVVSDDNVFQTLLDAHQRARDILLQHNKDNVEIRLKPGKHLLSEPLVLDDSDSRISFVGDDSSNMPVVSGGVSLEFGACAENDNLLCASVEDLGDNAQSRQLYVGDRRATRGYADSTVVDAFITPVSYDDDKYVVESDVVGTWMDPNTIELVYTAPPACQWTESRCTLLNVTATDVASQYEVFVKQPCFSIVQYKPCGQGTLAPTSIENTGVDVLVPGAWYLSPSSTTVYYYPLNETESVSILNGLFSVVMPVTQVLFSAHGVSDLTFDGIIFEHVTWLRPSNDLGYVEQQSGALVSEPAYNGECDASTWKSMTGNLIFNGTRNLVIQNCQFKHLGANGIYLTGGAQDSVVQSNLFNDISGAAIQIGDYDTQYETDESKQDRNNMVFNNLITGVAVEYHGNVAVSVGYTVGTNISHNEISDLPYGGVSIGWGWSRDNVTIASDNNVEYNYIHNFKTLLGDGGGIYALGPQPNSMMRNNHVSNMAGGRGGGGYYPDEGSAYWDVSNNVFSNASYCSDDCEWLHIWTSSIHNISVYDCYTDTATEVNAGTDCPEYNNTVVTTNDWPSEACDIAANAGLVSTDNDKSQARWLEQATLDRYLHSMASLFSDCEF